MPAARNGINITKMRNSGDFTQLVNSRQG